jgi:hypothetical protein
VDSLWQVVAEQGFKDVIESLGREAIGAGPGFALGIAVLDIPTKATSGTFVEVVPVVNW